ncbi:hypothetical protein [Mucilaginibacter lappiensis]|uniref:O-Antigen ligase n=1 Tax=Mucilaginibacter lappiensis TaxID=354630 RepID=A0A841JAF2_9SPHI|nr:hypothetical protein [Mucilaginibacter lappiensis]MBB6127760.1 hypothetical protein [Mucilaginibacter lappiensis]
MLTRAVAFYTDKIKDKVDWRLLTFLLLFLNVKLAIKIPVIILFSLWQFNFKFGFRFKDSRLPLFYPLIIVIVLVDWVIYQGYLSSHYNILLLTGIGFWFLCILAMHQIKLAVDNNPAEIVHQTITIFFVINALVSVLTLAVIILKTHTINPYTFQGEYQKYFINTGDYIRGIAFDTSITNSTLNAFGVIYFLTRKNAVMLLVCMAILLLTASNFINVVLLPILLLLFVFKTDRYQKSLVVVCLVFLVVFMAKISPQNNEYATQTLIHLFKKDKPVHIAAVPVNLMANWRITDRPDNTLTPEERKQKIATLYLDSVGRILDSIRESKRPKYIKNVYLANGGRIAITQPNLNDDYYQYKKETPVELFQLIGFIKSHKTALPMSGSGEYTYSMPGKAVGFLQTLSFFRAHLGKILTGTGMGNFSSKLAYRAVGSGFAGGYPSAYDYINHDFLVNHLDLYLYFYSKQTSFHSISNSTYSVYDQLLAEYGVLGLVLFIIFYLGFFAKHYQKLTYGLPILFLMLAVLLTDYWFEQLSVLVFFELLLLLNIKENKTVKPILQ